MKFTFVPLLLLVIPLVTAAETLPGRVVKVVNGDTVYFFDPAQEHEQSEDDQKSLCVRRRGGKG